MDLSEHPSWPIAAWMGLWYWSLFLSLLVHHNKPIFVPIFTYDHEGPLDQWMGYEPSDVKIRKTARDDLKSATSQLSSLFVLISISIRHWFNIFVSGWYLLNVNPMLFSIWEQDGIF